MKEVGFIEAEKMSEKSLGSANWDKKFGSVGFPEAHLFLPFSTERMATEKSYTEIMAMLLMR